MEAGTHPTDRATDEEILHARALALAKRPVEPPAAGSLIELLEFRLGNDRYAVETRHVHEVHPLRNLTPLPCSPAFVRGIVNVRGRITAAIDIIRFFGLPETGLTDLHCMVLIQRHGTEVGLLADAIVGVYPVRVHDLRHALEAPSGIRAEYLRGVTPQGLIVLDAERLLDDPGIIVEEEVQP